MVAVWSDKGNSSRERVGSMPAHGLRAHKAVRGYQPCNEQGVPPRRAAPRARDPGAAPRTRRGRPTRCARPPDRLAATSRRSSRGVKHVVQRSASASRPSSSLIVVRSWATPPSASKVVVLLEVAHLEVGGEGGERDPAARAHGPGHAVEDRARRGRARSSSPPPAASPKAPWQREMTASNSPSKGRARASSRSKVTPGGRVARGRGRRTAARCRRRGPRCRAGRARGRGGPARSPTSSTRMPGLEPERVDQEADLLLGPLRERVAQVGRPEVVGQVLEPVVALGSPPAGAWRTMRSRCHSPA